MKAVVSVDPGVTKGGCCVSVDGRVVKARTVIGYSPQDWAESVMLLAMDALASRDFDQVEWVVEKMVLRENDDVKHADLLRVEASVDRLRDLVRRSARLRGRWTRVTPESWKAACPKSVTARRIRKALEPSELEALRDDGHDMWDSVGINLFATKRLKRGMV